MVPDLPAGSFAGLPALRAGRPKPALHHRTYGTRTQPDRQFAGPQMGTHVHYAGNFRRRVFRLVPAFLLDQFRRGVLRLDADSAGLRPTSRFVRIPAKTQ